MGKGFDKPCVGGVNIPVVGGVKIPWVGGFNIPGVGVSICLWRGSKYHV